MAESSLRVVSISRTCGMFSRMTGSSVRMAAAIAGSAAFLAPLTRIVPSSGFPPRMTNLSIGLLTDFYSSGDHGFPGMTEGTRLEASPHRSLRNRDGLPDISARAFERLLGHVAADLALQHHECHGKIVPSFSESALGLVCGDSGHAPHDHHGSLFQLRILLLQVDHQVAVHVPKPAHRPG